MATIMLVEDDGAIRRTYGRALSRAGHAVREAADLAAATGLLEDAFQQGEPLDLVLLDLTLEDGDGASLLPLIRRLHPDSTVAVVSGHIDALRAIELSPECPLCVPKPVGTDILVRLVETALVRRDQRAVEAFARRMALSQQELHVLRGAMRGKSTKQIAESLACTPGTVKTYWQRIFDKTGLRSRASVIAAAGGITDRPPPPA